MAGDPSDSSLATELRDLVYFAPFLKMGEAMTKAAARIEALSAARADGPGGGWAPTHRHVKRGTMYQVLDEVDLQTEKPLSDYAVLTLYRGEDGRLWARPTSEFNDGRFAALSPAMVEPTAKPPEPGS